MDAGLSFPKDEKHAADSIRLKRRLCEFCISTKEGKVGHVGSPFCLWKKKRMKKNGREFGFIKASLSQPDGVTGIGCDTTVALQSLTGL